MKEASEKLGRGDLGLRIEKSGVTELDNVIEEFNRMAYNIEQQNNTQEQLFTEKINLEKTAEAHALSLMYASILAGSVMYESAG